MTFAKYVSIQLLAYGIDIGVFLLVLQTNLLNELWINVIGKLCAGIFAFILHRDFTFIAVEKGEIKNQAVRYFALLGLNIPIASGVFMLFLLWIAEPVTAKFIADIICVALTYAMSKHLVFIKHQSLGRE